MDTPQFKTAEYSATKSPESCELCHQPVGATYFRVNGDVACEACAMKAKSETPAASHAMFIRGLLFGIGGAIIGLILYATFAIATGLVIGYVSLAVGFIVGKAMKLGSRGFGGSHYQIAAVLLTYAAVSMAAVPIAIASYAKQDHAQHSTAATTDTAAPAANDASDAAASGSSPHSSFGSAILALVLIGLASPFLDLAQDPFHGLIGLVILAVGIRIAWKMTAGDDHAQVVGPFRNQATAAPAAPPSLG
jgi:predicted lipid-binding transport protein (Tim44 family)